MANMALADTATVLIAGIACGWDILLSGNGSMASSDCQLPPEEMLTKIPLQSSMLLNVTILKLGDESEIHASRFVFSFLSIAAWTAGVITYAMLALNRCVAICYYGTRAKSLNRVSVAIGLSLSTWIIGLTAAAAGTIPEPLMEIRRDMWTVSFASTEGGRPALFFASICSIDCVGIGAQWICSTLVLRKIQQVKQKICSNKLNQNSANRFRKQARLTFQFFYPSILCTLSTFLFFIKPYFYHYFTTWQMILLHIIWLCSHVCNPFIYAYFNDRMRHTYREMLSCARLRYLLRKRKESHFFRTRHSGSRRSNTQGKSNRMSTRSTKSRDNNFVRNSLQMQSRDFEQLCEFIMRVNPLYDSSEGWRESSDDESPREESRQIEMRRRDHESKSIVLDMGRQTVENWVNFAKKASI
ncbi:hypothetical protein OSTOST_00433 [Ostertagia ostertagi]